MVHFSNRRSKRADARRVAIIRAAAQVFRARGFAAAGMRDIAAAADLSPGNLYHYFGGKDELLFFCQEQSLERMLAALAVARRGSGPLDGRLRALAASHVLCLLDDVEGSAAHLEVDALPPALRARIVARRDRYERGLRVLIADGVRRRLLRAADPTIATRAFLGALNWTAHWFRPGGAQSPQHIAAAVADYAVAGLLNLSSMKAHPDDHPRAHRQRRTGRSRVRPVQDPARSPA